MIEALGKNLRWALKFEGVVVPEETFIPDPETWPRFEKVTIFIEVERWRRGPGNEIRIWAIGFPIKHCAGDGREGGPIVLVGILLPEASGWCEKATDLLGRFNADTIVPVDDSVALALYLAGVKRVCPLDAYLRERLIQTLKF